MARISSYGQDNDVEQNDFFIGTDGSGGGTKTFTLESVLSAYITNGDWGDLPTELPDVPGRIWNDAGTLKVTS